MKEREEAWVKIENLAKSNPQVYGKYSEVEYFSFLLNTTARLGVGTIVTFSILFKHARNLVEYGSRNVPFSGLHRSCFSFLLFNSF